jgi:hypothetical protein
MNGENSGFPPSRINRWAYRANSSFPVPLSPVTRTFEIEASAILSIFDFNSRTAGDTPTISLSKTSDCTFLR